MMTRQETGKARCQASATGSLKFHTSPRVGKYGRCQALNCTAKICIMPRAMKKIGMEKPMNENEVMTLSVSEYCLTAEITPKNTATATMKISATPMRISVMGKR